MACLFPLELKHPETGLMSQVHCGRCRYCRIRRKQAWVGRLMLESLDHEWARFLTLTYAEDPGVLDTADLRDFLKRYRYHYGPCRFFAVGEYGEKNKRGHWHLIIFGHPPEVRGHWLNNKAWDAGYSFDGTVTKDSIGYVAGYTLKFSGDRDKPNICRQSLKPGIGFKRIGMMAMLASREGLETWPTEYRMGGRRFPLTDGALTHFQKVYSESGGCPPSLIATPEQRDETVRIIRSDLGTRIRAEKRASAVSYKDVLDAFASQTKAPR